MVKVLERVQSARQWVREHPLATAALTALSFLFIFLPQWVSAVWSLFSDEPLIPSVLKKMNIQVPILSFSPYWITAPVGAVVLFAIIYLVLTRNRGVDKSVATPEEAKEPCPDESLHILAQADVESLPGLVFIKRCEIKNFNLEPDNLPFIEFEFLVFNASVYTVTIQDAIKGNVFYREYALLGDKSMTENKAFNLRHGKEEVFKISQRISPDECRLMVKFAKSHPSHEYYTHVDLRNLEVRFKVESDRVNTEPVMLQLPPNVRLPITISVEQLREQLNAEYERKAEELNVSIENLEGGKAILRAQLEEETKKYKSELSQKEDVLKHLSSVELELAELKAEYKWLGKIVEYQRGGLKKYVLVEVCTINDSTLSEGKRYIEFTFYVVNYSMFYVSVPMTEGEEIKGSIHFKGEMLSGVAKLVENKVMNCSPYSRGAFKIRQWVSQDEAKEILETLQTSGNFFDFSNANVYIRSDEFPDDKAAKLDLTRGMQKANLENKIIQLENDNAQLRREIFAYKERENYIEELTIALGTCHLASIQLKQGELLSEETIKHIKMRISHSLSQRPNEPKMIFDFFDQLPPNSDLNSVNNQRNWLEALCLEIQALIDEQREAQSLIRETNSLPKN